MPQDKTKPKDTVPQADKEHSTEIAERAGKEGDQAAVINKQQDKPKH
jgi:hypothetical protein